MGKMTDMQKAQEVQEFLTEEKVKIVGTYINTNINPKSTRKQIDALITVVCKGTANGMHKVIQNEIFTQAKAKGYTVDVETIRYDVLRDLVLMGDLSAFEADFDLASGHVEYDPEGLLVILQQQVIAKSNVYWEKRARIIDDTLNLEAKYSKEIAQPWSPWDEEANNWSDEDITWAAKAGKKSL